MGMRNGRTRAGLGGNTRNKKKKIPRENNNNNTKIQYTHYY
jgi:hypothetical protein